MQKITIDAQLTTKDYMLIDIRDKRFDTINDVGVKVNVRFSYAVQNEHILFDIENVGKVECGYTGEGPGEPENVHFHTDDTWKTSFELSESYQNERVCGISINDIEIDPNNRTVHVEFRY